MSKIDDFLKHINDGYSCKADFVAMNRHGLIAGATGTGKTKTLQAFVALRAMVTPHNTA